MKKKGERERREILSLKHGLAEASDDLLGCLFGRLHPIAQKTWLMELGGGFL